MRNPTLSKNFRHPGKYRRFSYAVDPEWERLYRSILANKPAGSVFEDAILKAGHYEKNTALMLPLRARAWRPHRAVGSFRQAPFRKNPPHEALERYSR